MSNKTPLIANVVDRYTGRDGSNNPTGQTWVSPSLTNRAKGST